MPKKTSESKQKASIAAKKNQQPYLKPCPFCGGNAVLLSESLFVSYQVQCHDCHCGTAWLDNKDYAVETWNNRMPEDDNYDR